MQTLFGMLPNRGKTTPNVGSRDAKSPREPAEGDGKNIFENFGFLPRNEGSIARRAAYLGHPDLSKNDLEASDHVI